MEVDPAAFAAEQARRFTGHRLRIGRSPVVHDIAWKDWLADLTLPVPACNQGWAGLAATDDLTATTDPANCRKCALTTGRTSHRHAPPFQTVLFDLDLESGTVDDTGETNNTPQPEPGQRDLRRRRSCGVRPPTRSPGRRYPTANAAGYKNEESVCPTSDPGPGSRPAPPHRKAVP